MAKKQAMQGTLRFFVKDSPVFVEGILVEQTDDQIVLDVKRPRSSKYDRRVFATEGLLQVYVTEETAIIGTRGEYEEVYGDMTLVSTSAGFGVFADEDGNQIVCAPGTWEFTAEPEAAEEKPKKAPAKKAKAKPVEEEDDDDVDDDFVEDDDEEEKPKAKGKGKKAVVEDDDEEEEKPKAKAKGKGKKAVVEEEEGDDDWE